VTVSRVIELPGVRGGIEAARDAMDLLRKQRILRNKGVEVRALAFSESARATAELGAVDIAVGIALVEAAIETSASIASSPMQILARYHSTALADSTSHEQRGRPRVLNGSESERLFGLNDLLHSPSQVPALIVASLVMAEISDIAPFDEANDLIARTAFRAILIGRGFDPDALGMPEAGMSALGAGSFVQALAAYHSGTPDGVAAWLRHVANAVQLGARRGVEICDSLAG